MYSNQIVFSHQQQIQEQITGIKTGFHSRRVTSLVYYFHQWSWRRFHFYLCVRLSLYWSLIRIQQVIHWFWWNCYEWSLTHYRPQVLFWWHSVEYIPPGGPDEKISVCIPRSVMHDLNKVCEHKSMLDWYRYALYWVSSVWCICFWW